MTHANQRLPIALDAMGGDFAPAAAVEGALDALRRFQLPVLLVGDELVLQRELARLGAPGQLPIMHAAETISMDEHAATAVRKHRASSMHLCCRLVKEGQAAAAVSAGNSGAFFGVAMFTLGRVSGVDRPALATIFPTTGLPVLLLDIGANTEVKPQHLVQFAVMGSIYAQRVLHRSRPSVALLSNGEEAEKGPLVVQDAHQRLKQLDLNFVGNIEGKDVARGIVDVIVSDGFAGNVLIKTAEGVAETMLALVRAELTSSLLNRLLAAGLRPAFRQVRARLDYAEYGGAPLLGIQGVAIIAHGRSNANAIANAIRVAAEAVDNGVIEAIRAGMAGFETPSRS